MAEKKEQSENLNVNNWNASMTEDEPRGFKKVITVANNENNEQREFGGFRRFGFGQN